MALLTSADRQTCKGPLYNIFIMLQLPHPSHGIVLLNFCHHHRPFLWVKVKPASEGFVGGNESSVYDEMADSASLLWTFTLVAHESVFLTSSLSWSNLASIVQFTFLLFFGSACLQFLFIYLFIVCLQLHHKFFSIVWDASDSYISFGIRYTMGFYLTPEHNLKTFGWNFLPMTFTWYLDCYSSKKTTNQEHLISMQIQ